MRICVVCTREGEDVIPEFVADNIKFSEVYLRSISEKRGETDWEIRVMRINGGVEEVRRYDRKGNLISTEV